MFRFSLKTKMTIATSVMVAVLISIAAFFALHYLEKQLKQMISKHQSGTVTAIADQLDDKLNLAHTELISVASTITPEMAADPARAHRFLLERPDTRAIFDNGVYLFSVSGKIIAGAPIEPQMREMNFSKRPYFSRTLATGKPQISDPFISAQSTRHPIVMFTAPVFDRNGRMCAILAGSLDLLKENFLGKLAFVTLGQKGYLYLCNTARLVIVHHDRNIMMKYLPAGSNVLLDKAVRGYEGTGQTRNFYGLQVITSFKRLKSTGWILAGSLPESEAYEPVHRAQRYVLVALLLAIGVSVPVVWLLARHITAPLAAITEQVRDLVGQKGMLTRIRGANGIEMQVLTDAFNAVLAELEAQKTELNNQLQFSRDLIATIPYPLYYKNLNGIFLDCNTAFESCIGVPVHELVGKTVYDIQPQHLAEIYHQADHDLLESGGVQIYETSVLFADGLCHDVIFHKGIVTAADGSPSGILGSILDISDRKRSEKALEKTRRQLQLILEAAGEGIYGVDMDGTITFVNPAAAKMTGHEQQELLGVSQHEVIHHRKPDGTFYQACECQICAAFKDGRQRHVRDEVFWRKDGSSFPVEYVSNPIVENGEPVGAVVVFKDITEQMATEDQLLKLSQAITQSPVSVVITDTEGVIEYVNDTFIELSGYDLEDVIGQNPRIFKSGQTSPEVYRNLWNTIKSGQVWVGELHNRRKDGELCWEQATISPIRNSAGVVTHYMAYKENISERKKLEAQLRHAQKMEAVGQLAGGVAHDFNNILTVITGFGELLQNSLQKADPRHKHLDQILSAANRAAHLTGSLLAFSRKQLVLLVPTDITKLVRKHTKFLGRIIGEDVSLETKLGTQPLMVLADGGQVEQVLMNLATNARDAMPGGGVLRIELSETRLDKEFYRLHGFGPPGLYALIAVRDTGMGMDQETQKRIFEPFYTTKELGRGTGLGLSIVYGIVKQHGGFITVTSQPGEGTSFNVYLPIISPTAEAEKPAELPLPDGGSETILLAEDDPAVRDLVESVLLEYGYDVVLARDGQEAVDLFRTHSDTIELALFDVIMPRKSGKEACDELRQMKPGVKVLLLSGYTADLIENRGILVDGVDLMMKPVQPNELARKIREMLDA